MPIAQSRPLSGRMTPPRLLYWLANLLALLIPVAGFAADVTGVGIATLRIPDPVSGKMTDGDLFYPTSQPTEGTVALGPYNVAATPHASAIPGPKPLVVLSHGNGGSDLGHHDLATYLASHGFMVATLNHLGDYFRDTSGVGHIEVLAGRPVQVKATINTLLADPQWKALIDPSRIGVAGFSAGGYTSLMIAGAKPRFDRFIAFCDRYPDDKDVCGHRAEFEASAKKRGQTMEQMLDEMQGQLGRYGDTADPRVKAVFAMAPLSLIFDEHSFENVHIPVFLYYGENDHVLPPEANAKHIQPMIPNLAGVKEIPKADHWVFLPPCSPELQKEIPAMCRDPQGVDRAKAHAQINADALAFFRKTLDVH